MTLPRLLVDECCPAPVVAALRDLGFDEYPIANYGTDPDGNPRDMVKMVLAL